MLAKLNKNMDVISSFLVVAIIMMMILPIPPAIMDVLLGINITIALIILLVSIYVKKPLEFSVFPSILLIITLFRLGLNVASTRLILLQGHTGEDAAGDVIKSFGQFVVGGNYVVGIIIFLILIAINFIVITKGATRVAEVGARFVLDSMPGKQMAIDADLNAGIIHEDQARNRRREIEHEADFYGAMDGASKFVRGDAIAGLIITAINIIGGFIIGVAQQGLPVANAAATYTILTVGDGLVSQIPALVISTAAGIVITRTTTEVHMGEDVFKQLFQYWRVLMVVGVVLLLLAIMPGMPTIIFLMLSAIMITAAYFSRRYMQEGGEVIHGGEGAKGGAKGAEGEAPVIPPHELEAERIEQMLQIDLLSVEVGYDLIGLVDRNRGGELLERITALRRQFASSLGIIVPPVHIRDNLQLAPSTYRVLLRGMEIASHTVMKDRFLAMNPGDVDKEIEGIDTVEPAFGLPARWVTEANRERAEALGYTVVDGSTVIATHLSELIKRHAHELVGRQELQQLLDILTKQNAKLVEELIPERFSMGELLRVIKNLLKENISIRDLRGVIETIADYVGQTRNPEVLTELVRQRLARSITGQFKSPDNRIYAITFERSVEDMFRTTQQFENDDIQAALSPDQAHRILNGIEKRIKEASLGIGTPVLLVSPEIRRAIRNFVTRFMPDLAVISHREVDPGVEIKLVGTVAI